MDIGKSLSYVFEDERWISKLLIGGLLMLAAIVLVWTFIVPIVVAALWLGYTVQIIHNVQRGERRPLPEWDEWGTKIGLGIKLFVVTFVWALPATLLGLPNSIATALSDNGQGLGLLGACLSCLAALYWLFLWLATPGIYTRFAEDGNIGSGFDFSRIWSFTRNNLGTVVVVQLVLIAVGFVAGLIGIVLCVIGVLFTSFYVVMVQGHLYGQFGAKARAVVDANKGYDLLPEQIMPGVGELTADVKTGADEAVAQIEEVAVDTDEAAPEMPDEPKPDNA